MNWESCPNFSFTAENKMGNLKGWTYFKINMRNEIFHLLIFQEFINKLEKICFPLGKIEF